MSEPLQFCCYVCFESCQTRSQCGCNERYIHDHCLVQFISTRHNYETACPVCTQTIRNVKVTKKIKRRLESFVLFTCFALFVASIEIGFLLFFANGLHGEFFVVFTIGTTLSSAVLFTTTVIIVCLIRVMIRRNCTLCKEASVSASVTLVDENLEV